MKNGLVSWCLGLMWVATSFVACGGSSDPEPPVFAAYNPAKTDSDGDGVVDAEDAFPSDAAESLDFDGDGVGDNADPDDDNDGVPDVDDAFPKNASEVVDTDGDGVGDNTDSDDDGDGVPDIRDAFPTDDTRTDPDPTTLPGSLYVEVVGLLGDTLIGDVVVSLDSGQEATLPQDRRYSSFDYVPAGSAVVTVKGKGYATVVETVEVPAGNSADYTFTLVPGVRIADTPTAQAVSMANGGADFLVFDNGFPKAFNYGLEGDFWLIDLDGGNRRDLVSGVAPSDELSAGFSPNHGYFYVAERAGKDMKVRVFDLAAVSELSPIASGCSVPSEFNGTGLALTSSSSAVGADARCIVPITGGDRFHAIPEDAILRGFGTDGAYYYVMPSKVSSGSSLVRVDPVTLNAKSLARIASKVYTGNSLVMNYLIPVDDGAVVAAVCPFKQKSCLNPVVSLISPTGDVTPLDPDSKGSRNTTLLRDAWVITDMFGILRVVPLTRTTSLAVDPIVKLTNIPSDEIVRGDPGGDHIIHRNDDSDLASTRRDNKTKVILQAEDIGNIYGPRLCVSGEYFALADGDTTLPVVYMGRADGTGNVQEFDLSADDTVDEFYSVTCFGEVTVVGVRNIWGQIEIRPVSSSTGLAVFDLKTLNVGSMIDLQLPDSRQFTQIWDSSDPIDFYTCDFSGTANCEMLVENVLDYQYFDQVGRFIFRYPGIPPSGGGQTFGTFVGYDYAARSALALPAVLGEPYLVPLDGADYYFGMHPQYGRLMAWKAGADEPGVSGFFGGFRLRNNVRNSNMRIVEGIAFAPETVDTDILVDTIVSWSEGAYGSYVNWYPEAAADNN